MKPYNRTVQGWILASFALLGGFCSPAQAQQRHWAEAQQIPAAAVACYFVGRAFLNASGQGQVVGYFTDINGIGASDSLFNGTPSEQTAFFTFRSNVFSLTPLLNGDIGLDLTSAGTFNIYHNPNPNGDWSKPDTFSAANRSQANQSHSSRGRKACSSRSCRATSPTRRRTNPSPNMFSLKPWYRVRALHSKDRNMTSASSCPVGSHSTNCSVIQGLRG
jgi:hypothetical protein